MASLPMRRHRIRTWWRWAASVLTANDDGPSPYDTFNVTNGGIFSTGDEVPTELGTWNSEVGWGNPKAGKNSEGQFFGPNGNFAGGSGGGYTLFPTPSYQQGGDDSRRKSNHFE